MAKLYGRIGENREHTVGQKRLMTKDHRTFFGKLKIQDCRTICHWMV